jgi:hypothetical protein
MFTHVRSKTVNITTPNALHAHIHTPYTTYFTTHPVNDNTLDVWSRDIANQYGAIDASEALRNAIPRMCGPDELTFKPPEDKTEYDKSRVVCAVLCCVCCAVLCVLCCVMCAVLCYVCCAVLCVLCCVMCAVLCYVCCESGI